ncbi:hypothetical protein BDZ89DRAFT_1042886 [Hymenopellis radicata]|nr:hypothetical protein BDZ89DRAFT_1042886 [Hymenopellis radicata]
MSQLGKQRRRVRRRRLVLTTYLQIQCSLILLRSLVVVVSPECADAGRSSSGGCRAEGADVVAEKLLALPVHRSRELLRALVWTLKYLGEGNPCLRLVGMWMTLHCRTSLLGWVPRKSIIPGHLCPSLGHSLSRIVVTVAPVVYVLLGQCMMFSVSKASLATGSSSSKVVVSAGS